MYVRMYVCMFPELGDVVGSVGNLAGVSRAPVLKCMHVCTCVCICTHVCMYDMDGLMHCMHAYTCTHIVVCY